MSKSIRTVTGSDDCACSDMGPCVAHEINPVGRPERPSEVTLIRLATLTARLSETERERDEARADMEGIADYPDSLGVTQVGAIKAKVNELITALCSSPSGGRRLARVRD